MEVISVSLSPEDIAQVNQIAEEENRSRSQVVKRALDHYAFERHWNRMRQLGDIISKRMGIESDDDVERIAD